MLYSLANGIEQLEGLVDAAAHLVDDQRRGALVLPALIVAPTSLVGNWQRELAKFAPSLRTTLLYGGDPSSVSVPGRTVASNLRPTRVRDDEARKGESG